jgi:hypothetical protein
MFVMIFFGLMGLAALVIDMGFARLTQQQMQTAVDSAALEGLRNNPTTAYGRQQANQIVAAMFSDNVDSSGQTVHYGAGPVVNFGEGIGPATLAASQLMTPGDPPVYQPGSLELNSENSQQGDMVSGTYSTNASYDPTESADEDASYNRRDFTPNVSSTSAFLVRMRRTGNSNDINAGVSSSGPTIPFLFGRGSMMARSGASGQLSVASGITVRATAIAGSQPAKTVGPVYSNNGGALTPVAQLAPFAIRSDLWTTLTTAGTTSGITVNPLAAGSGAVILDGQFRIALTAVGQPLVASADDSALLSGPQSALYVPIYADYSSQPATIIGFVFYNTWSYASGSLTLLPPGTAVQIGGQNVSPTMALALPATLAPTDVAAMLQAHANLFNQYPLYAPALVNHYIGPTQ